MSSYQLEQTGSMSTGTEMRAEKLAATLNQAVMLTDIPANTYKIWRTAPTCFTRIVFLKSNSILGILIHPRLRRKYTRQVIDAMQTRVVKGSRKDKNGLEGHAIHEALISVSPVGQISHI